MLIPIYVIFYQIKNLHSCGCRSRGCSRCRSRGWPPVGFHKGTAGWGWRSRLGNWLPGTRQGSFSPHCTHFVAPGRGLCQISFTCCVSKEGRGFKLQLTLVLFKYSIQCRKWPMEGENVQTLAYTICERPQCLPKWSSKGLDRLERRQKLENLGGKSGNKSNQGLQPGANKTYPAKVRVLQSNGVARAEGCIVHR